MRSRFLRALPVCVTLLVAVVVAFAVVQAAIGIPAGTPYSQTFDSIGTTATATLPVDFRVDRSTTVRMVGTYAAAGTTTTQVGGANLGGSATNGIYNFGSGTTTTGPDRAIGVSRLWDRDSERQFIYNWQTPKKAGFCYVVTVTLTDGSTLSGKIQLR